MQPDQLAVLDNYVAAALTATLGRRLSAMVGDELYQPLTDSHLKAAVRMAFDVAEAAMAERNRRLAAQEKVKE
jgi:hypothetical protein